MYLKGKNVLVYGYSISGKAAAKLLADEGAKVFIYDDKEITGLASGLTLVSDLRQAVDQCEIIVLSPSISIYNSVIQKAINNGKQVISELELGYRFCNSDIIAITGTNGKTTTTLLVSEILNRAGHFSYALGNIGIALSDKVKELNPSDTAVVEVSSFQLEAVNYFSPDISAILNVSPDHLDRHKTLENYLETKSNIFAQQARLDFAVFNADDDLVKGLAAKSKANNYFFSKKTRVNGSYVEKNVIYFENFKKTAICNVSELALLGDHNLENALAAATICMLKGVNPEIIRMVLKTFSLPDFRMQYIGEKKGKKFYNDSKGTNIAATLAATKSVKGRSILILGGSDKCENFNELFSALPETVVHIFVTGDNSPKIIESAIQNGYFNISHRSNLGDCVTEISDLTAENVIFSPSSASFDRFIDYKDRGRVFNACFEAL